MPTPAKGLPVVRLSLSLPCRVLLTVTYRLTDLWPGRRPRAEGRSQTFCSPLLRGLIALTRSYYIIPTLLIFINLISRARVSFVYSSLSLIIIIIVVRKLYERRGGGLRKEFFLLILVSTATVDGVDRVEEVGNEVCPSEHTRLLRAWTLRVLRGAGRGRAKNYEPRRRIPKRILCDQLSLALTKPKAN